MAWRIDEAVVRGEIDNRERGRVRGRIWLVGRDEPIELDLRGNAWRDVAGRELHFVNRNPQLRDLGDLPATQSGTVGDITASRKVKVPDVPMDELRELIRAKKSWTWHWGNALYLEWFSETHGRLVIESADYDLIAVGEATWEMSEAEEAAQREANSRAVTAFFDELNAAFDADEIAAVEETRSEWTDDEPPMTEEEAEIWQARQDLLIDRVNARLKREGGSADFEEILAEEQARLRDELGEPEPMADDSWLDEQFEDSFDPEASDERDLASARAQLEDNHPLVQRAKDLFVTLHFLSLSEGWLDEATMEEHPVKALIIAAMSIGPKLAGALNGEAWPPALDRCGLKIVRLKRARGYVDDALGATECCQQDNLIPPEHLGPVVVELIDLAHEIDRYIGELRERLGGGEATEP
ncbi:hypothetical protein [Synoicihabitans lomoniglobus]|uniref:Uncharacterized protein n=1 Tax=Synoicihabitans lomoniglobus TaxID=2909285 RepID=A0AAE9ZWL1_9BACT|nr:hypothetical protein [Opitutaceae bacterium LMO-M01]WED64424.1 hypothetical protein PXH66_18960 [Opitutaceae bacterium LMO-M01]